MNHQLNPVMNPHINTAIWRPLPRRRAPSRWAFAPFTALLSVLLMAASTSSHAAEEPDYSVVRKLGNIELRSYAPYTVAEVLIQGAPTEVGTQAFPILAGYIFGKNKDARQFPMTSPVIQSAQSRKLAMTAPVIQTPGSGGIWVQFVLPKGVNAANAPKPLDARVSVRDVPAFEVAVIRYSGFWSDANYSDHLAQLQAALTQAAVVWTGEPMYSRYNAPYTPWFMRRNEIWLQIAPSSALTSLPKESHP
jgi:SOUL heme-binding protein